MSKTSAPRRAVSPQQRQRREDVRGLLLRINEEVAALPNATLRAIVPVLRDAERELVKDLARWLSTADGEARFTAQQFRNALVQVRGAMEKVGKMEPELIAQLKAGGETAGRTALGHLQKELAYFALHFGSSISPIPLLTSAIVVKGEKAMIPRFRTSAARYVSNIQKDIRHQLAVGLVRKENFRELTHRLVRLGGPRGIVALRGIAGEPGALVENIAEGLFRRYRHWGERIVRTECIAAYGEVAQLGQEECVRIDPKSMKRWIAAIDGRVCIICRELDGVTVDVDASFPAMDKQPPAHPRCRCCSVVWRSDWTEK